MMGRVAAIALGAVLLVAGVAKRSDPRWPSKAAELGAPPWVVRVLPWLELALGALLVAGVARRAVSTVAAAVLVAFTVLLVVRLAQGRRPPCACFGARSTRPIGAGSVVRNLVLLALAIVALVA
jgi:uncharacterized membrane protein YphA (DoxX/SURF4 family)